MRPANIRIEPGVTLRHADLDALGNDFETTGKGYPQARDELRLSTSGRSSRRRRTISPFVFSTMNERSILRFLKLIGCDNGKIGTYAKGAADLFNGSRSAGTHCQNRWR
ncbi:hypothetical protein [Immundisolibacter sp.]